MSNYPDTMSGSDYCHTEGCVGRGHPPDCPIRLVPCPGECDEDGAIIVGEYEGGYIYEDCPCCITNPDGTPSKHPGYVVEGGE